MRRFLIPLVVLVLALGACGSDDDSDDDAATEPATTERTTTTEEQGTPIERAVEQVDADQRQFFDVLDDGEAVAIDGGTFGIGADISNTAMVLVLLDAPDSIGTRIDQTRALDGRQEYEWSGDEGRFVASWTYHPDNGLDMLIEEA